jgi:uncharacterized membrane protein SpoIIM required for sporulation
LTKEALLTSRRASIPYRIVFLAIGTIVFVLSYWVGAVLPLSAADAETIRSDFLAEIENIDQAGIFLNNIAVALAMFVPGAGVGVGVYSGVSTGVVYNAFAQVTPELQGVSPLALLVTPFGLLEILAYGLAMSRSGMLVAQLIKSRKDWRRFALFTAVEIGIVIAALILGSLIETQIIQNQQV